MNEHVDDDGRYPRIKRQEHEREAISICATPHERSKRPHPLIPERYAPQSHHGGAANAADFVRRQQCWRSIQHPQQKTAIRLQRRRTLVAVALKANPRPGQLTLERHSA